MESIEKDSEVVIASKEDFIISGRSVPLDARSPLIEDQFAIEIKNKAPKPNSAKGEAILVSPIFSSVSSTVGAQNHNLHKREVVIGLSVFYPTESKDYVSDDKTDVYKPCVAVETIFDTSSFVLFHPSVNGNTEREALERVKGLIDIDGLKWQESACNYGVVVGSYDRSKSEE